MRYHLSAQFIFVSAPLFIGQILGGLSIQQISLLPFGDFGCKVLAHTQYFLMFNVSDYKEILNLCQIIADAKKFSYFCKKYCPCQVLAHMAIIFAVGNKNTRIWQHIYLSVMYGCST